MKNKKSIDHKGLLTYQEDIKFLVFLDGKKCGFIYKESGGYRYYPDKSKAKIKGGLYPTLKECKKSLESD